MVGALHRPASQRCQVSLGLSLVNPLVHNGGGGSFPQTSHRSNNAALFNLNTKTRTQQGTLVLPAEAGLKPRWFRPDSWVLGRGEVPGHLQNRDKVPLSKLPNPQALTKGPE